MNTYTFIYYAYSQETNCFERQWFDIPATDLEDAQLLANACIKTINHGPALVAINGYSLEDYMARLAILN